VKKFLLSIGVVEEVAKKFEDEKVCVNTNTLL
jgi:hypothetical protein